ncbi:MAG: CRTAC1 family protein [Isosphaeraceae bacterium]
MSVQKETSPFRFSEIHKEAGIDFVHFSGMTETKHFPTANGSGVALIDYDNDGKLDLYFATCTLLPLGTAKKGSNRLYRNLGENRFEDVTEKAGVGYAGFCHGAVAGDVDNDGDQDLVLCNYGPNVLYRNNGNGTFTDVSKSSGLHRPALVGSLVFDQGSGDGSSNQVTIDAVSGPAWKVGDGTSTKVRLPVRKGTKIVVRQADIASTRGIKFRNPELVQRRGEPEKSTAVLREIGEGPSRIDIEIPPLAKEAPPEKIAEFEVLREFETPVMFTCKVFDRAWSSAGAFIDYDNDGDLDLYVSNYGEWDYPEDDQFCGDDARKIRLYCSPRTIRTVRHFFFRNNGDGTFTDVYDQVIRSIDLETKQHKPRSDGHGFGVVTADLNNDGKIDIYVANDMNPNFLFLNKGDGTFEDATESAGAAYDDKGQAQSGMGVDAEDVNGDGLPELFVTNFANEYNTLYQNMGQGIFSDSTPYFGLAADTMPWVGWGTALVDLDNDGWPDNFVANGHVDDNRHALGQDVDYAELSLLFSNRGGQRFRLATRDVGPYFESKHVSRGAAFGDIDNDGDLDIIVNNKDDSPALLRNDSKHDHHWIRVELQGTRSNRDGVGARIEVVADGRTIVRQRKGGYSLESSNDPRIHVGVGKAKEVARLTVRWPSGLTSTLEKLATGQSYKVVEPNQEPASTAQPKSSAAPK